jgi:anaerobic selenocysteine-containing dehydrogenase
LGSKHPGDFLLAVTRRLGSPIRERLPFESFEQAVEHSAQDILTLQRGYPFGTPLEEVWDNLLERSGWWAPDYSTADELWQQMKKEGGWWDPTYHYGEWGRVFQTPSGKFEFFSQILWKHILTEMKSHAGSMDLVSAERRCLPHFESSAASALVAGDRAVPADQSQNSFVLYPYEILPLSEASGADLPFLQQNLGQHLFERWESWIEIHPETAQRLGIEDGNWVWVESARQKLRLRARLFPGLRPEVVAMPIGLGHRNGSRWSQGRGVNVNELLEPLSSDPTKTLNGDSRWFSTRVRISRA